MIGDTFLPFIDGVPHGIDVRIKRFIKVQNSLTHKLTNSKLINSQTQKLTMAHGHEVLHMMAGNTYESKEALVKAIINKFGEAERFHTCSAEGMTAAQLVDFLEARGKFMPASSNQFTVDESKICKH